VGIRKSIRINGLRLWCARRAVAFAAISMGCLDYVKYKVHFERKGTFEDALEEKAL